jgi:hypothetical protein
VTGNIYFSLLAEPWATVNSPPVVLQAGTAGNSIIYVNGTSAKTSAIAPAPAPAYYPSSYHILSENWYTLGWNYRKRIIVNHAQVQANLTAFPVLINLTSDSNLASHAQSNSNDILFTSSDGMTKLSHEIEEYTSTTGALVAWVKVSNLSSSVDTDLYMYYGNSTCDSQQDAISVWDSNFKGVWHLKEDPSSTAPQMKDSTFNGNNGTSSGSMTTSDQVTGKIDGSLDFDGSNDEITCGNTASLQITTEITIEAWAETSSTGAVRGIVNKETTSYVGYQLRKHSDNYYRFATGNPGTSGQYVASDSAYTDSNWHYIVGVRRSGTNYLYIDGVQQTAMSTYGIIDSDADFDIGRAYSNYNGYWWTGIIDEVRVSNIGRNASWIATCYNNQNSPSTFYSIGVQEENPKVSGTIPASLQTVDSNYFVVRSTGSATSTTEYNPSGYNLNGSTTLVSGTTNDLVSNDSVYMTFRSYASQTSSTTFGYTTAGGSYTIVSADQMYGSVFTSPAYSDMTVQSITFRGRRDGFSGTANVKGVLVRHSDLTMVAVGNPVSISTTTNWYTSTFSSPPSIPASTDYVIMLVPDASTRFYYGTGSTNQGHYDTTNSYTTPTNPTDATHNNNQYSVYCTFTYTSQHTCEVEFTGTSNTESWTQLVWTIDSSFTADSVTATLQLYNYQTDSYPTSGDGYMTDTIGTNDVTKTQTITTNPTNFRNASGNWKIKVMSVKSTNSQFDFKADWVEFKPAHYSEYTASTEFLFSSMTKNTPTQLNFTIVSQYNIANVNVTIQVWNYSSPGYVTSGEGYLTYISSGSNETKMLSINTNPQIYASSGNARIKITGVKTTTTQYQQETNQAKILYSYNSSSTYNYVLKVVNNVTDTWKIRLKAYSQSNIGRLNNCTIYFHNASDGFSGQVYIVNGNYAQQAGPWYDLPASPAERYIAVALEADNSEVSYINVYLEILIPNKTTYIRYILTFEFT